MNILHTTNFEELKVCAYDLNPNKLKRFQIKHQFVTINKTICKLIKNNWEYVSHNLVDIRKDNSFANAMKVEATSLASINELKDEIAYG